MRERLIEQVFNVLIVDTVEDLGTFPPAGDKAQVAQHAQLMGNRALAGLGALRQV